LEFITADANGFRMESSNLGNLFDTPMPATSGFASSHPTPLLLVQTTENQIEIPMVLFFRMIASPTRRTSTLMNRIFRCHDQPPSLVEPEAYSIQPNRGIDSGQVPRSEFTPMVGWLE